MAHSKLDQPPTSMAHARAGTKSLVSLHSEVKGKNAGEVLGVLVCVHFSPAVRRVLSSTPSRFLGHISFSLYLCHQYISRLLESRVKVLGIDAMYAIVAPTAIFVAFLVSPIDILAQRVAKKVASYFVPEPCEAVDECIIVDERGNPLSPQPIFI